MTTTATPRPKLFSSSFWKEWDSIKSAIRKINRQTFGIIPTGGVIYYAGGTVPDGYLVCNGAIQNISDFPDLFTAIGATFGGNGTTTFGVPLITGGRFIRSSAGGFVAGTVTGTAGATTLLTYQDMIPIIKF